MSEKRYEAMLEDRKKVEERVLKAQEGIFEYGNFCVKMLVTLNSSAMLATLAFIGSYSQNNLVVTQAQLISDSIPFVFFCWSLGLSFILIAALFTYFCHRWVPDMLWIWHKRNYVDIYKELNIKEKISLCIYDLCMWIGIIAGMLSLGSFLMGIWTLVYALL